LFDAAFADAAEGREGDGDLIGGHGERLAMKISATDDVPIWGCGLVAGFN